jgi:hypothetical protein
MVNDRTDGEDAAKISCSHPLSISYQFQRRFRSACGHLRDCFVLLREPIPDHLREI